MSSSKKPTINEDKAKNAKEGGWLGEPEAASAKAQLGERLDRLEAMMERWAKGQELSTKGGDGVLGMREYGIE